MPVQKRKLKVLRVSNFKLLMVVSSDMAVKGLMGIMLLDFNFIKI